MSNESLVERSVVIDVRDDRGVFVEGATVVMTLGERELVKAENITIPPTFHLNDTTTPLKFVASYGKFRGEVRLAPDVWRYEIRLNGLKLPRPSENPPFYERHLVFICGCVGLAIGMWLAISYPRSARPDLYKWMAIVFAISAGCVASEIPGFLNVKLSIEKRATIAAGGAIAVFVILFFFNPA